MTVKIESAVAGLKKERSLRGRWREQGLIVQVRLFLEKGTERKESAEEDKK